MLVGCPRSCKHLIESKEHLQTDGSESAGIPARFKPTTACSTQHAHFAPRIYNATLYVVKCDILLRRFSVLYYTNSTLLYHYTRLYNTTLYTRLHYTIYLFALVYHDARLPPCHNPSSCHSGDLGKSGQKSPAILLTEQLLGLTERAFVALSPASVYTAPFCATKKTEVPQTLNPVSLQLDHFSPKAALNPEQTAGHRANVRDQVQKAAFRGGWDPRPSRVWGFGRVGTYKARS